MKTIPILLLSIGCSFGQTVLSTDFESGIPSSVTPGTAGMSVVQGFAGLGAAGNQFQGMFLRSATANKVSVDLTNLPPHNVVSIAFLLAAIDSLDGSGSFPAGDYFHIKLDGVTIFRESLANATTSQIQSYVPASGALLARRVDLGFSGPGSYYTDSAYDFGVEPRLRNIRHLGPSLHLELIIEGGGVQSLTDESWAMDNLSISVANLAAPSNTPSLAYFEVTYPLGPTPHFSGLMHDGQPMSLATLQASTDLGVNDPWESIGSTTVNSNGSVSFTNAPDLSAAGSPRNFYRVVVTP